MTRRDPRPVVAGAATALMIRVSAALIVVVVISLMR